MNKSLEKVRQKILSLNEREREIFFSQMRDEFFKEENIDTNKALKQGSNMVINFPNLINEKFTKALLVETGNGNYLVQPEDNCIGLNLRKYGENAIEQIEYLANFISSETKLLIVGAHIGTLTIPLSRIAKLVFAVEANPISYKLLKYNLAINNTKNCKAFNFAANDKPTELEFLLNTQNSGGSKRKPIIQDHMYYYDNPEQISVPAFRLDDVFKNKKFNVVLMDIEGSEYFALKGMQRILSSATVLIVEFLPHHLRNVSGISVDTFLKVLPGFKIMIVPSLRIRAKRKKFSKILTYMFDNNIGDENLIFIK
ncbi:FkbM family methyltransferase [Pedobacter sp. 22163]|uniref:FkbM family methyltransferase n=1 Tax=Pedobacter sp. 22163 TaxID=3453883 RepID=UPI003F82C43B